MKRLSKIFHAVRSINVLAVGNELLFFSRFFALVVFFLFFEAVRFLGRRRFISFFVRPLAHPFARVRIRILNLFNSRADGEISSLDLITLAVRHLTVKKTRTMITIGGMAIGFGAVIFLLSLGYGVQRLVVSRVARLGEMQQINITVGQASALRLNDQTLDEFSKLEHVTSVIPMASVVSKVTYNNSVSDAVAYGVTRQYLEESAIQPTRGTLFEDGVLSALAPIDSESVGQVAGAQVGLIPGAKMQKQYSQIRYSLHPLVWKAIYSAPSMDAEIIGYTTRVVGNQEAIEVWGSEYSTENTHPRGVDSFSNEYALWIKDSFPIWKKEPCTSDTYGCIDNQYQPVKAGSQQEIREGFIQQQDVSLERYTIIQDSGPRFEEGEVVDRIQFSLTQREWYQVYSDAKNEASSLNVFTTQENAEVLFTGELVFGESYFSADGWGNAGKNERGTAVGYWIRAKLPIWKKVDCKDCDSLYLKETDADEQHIYAQTYIRADRARIEGLSAPLLLASARGAVLGESTSSAELTTATESSAAGQTSTLALADISPTEIVLPDGAILKAETQDDGSLSWVTIASNSAGTARDTRRVLPYPENGQKVAIVNRALLSVFNIPEADAIGKEFITTFMLDEEFFEPGNSAAESEPVSYKIIGVVPDEKTPSYFLPFSDIKNLGIANYSQVKVIVSDQNQLKNVRQSIEALGYKTASVADTVGKINSLFDTVRLLLSLLGFVALSVAALGMFNTLTISLLEKTREVGLMKAIGMKSSEVKRLFLAESIVTGLSGGIFGLLLSFITGHTLSFLLSLISVTKGLGYISLVYIPFGLGVSIVSLAFVIGIATGLYPSHRATKISALNALRYE